MNLKILGLGFLLFIIDSTVAMADECRMTWSRDLSQPEYLPIIKSNLNHLVAINQDRSIQLFTTTSDGDSRPDLAESWRFNHETHSLELKLPDDCGWSDGMPITSYDMKAGIEAVFSRQAAKQIAGRDSFRNGNAVYAGELPLGALGIQTPDASTLYIPAAGSLELLKSILTITQYTPVPLHKLESDPEYWSRPGMPLVASGPFFPVEVSLEKIVMQRNPHFCGDGSIGFDEVVFFNNAKSAEPSFDLHLIKNEQLSIFGLSTAWRNDIGFQLREIDEKYHKITMKPPRTDYLHLNLTRPAFSDARVRQALSLGLEIEEFSSIQLSGPDSYVPDSIIPVPGIEGNYPHPAGPRTDRIARARRLLEDAGYSQENPLLIRFLTRDSHVQIRLFTNAIASMLSPLPIKLDMDWKHSTTEYYETMLNKGRTDYDMYTSIWRQEIPDPSNYLVHLRNYANFSAETKALLNRLIEQPSAEHGVNSRYQLFSTLNKLMQRDRSLIPLSRHYDTLFVSNDIKQVLENWYGASTRNFTPLDPCF